MVLVLSLLSDDALYLCKVSLEYLIGFQSYCGTSFSIFGIFKGAYFCKKCRESYGPCSLHIV